MKKLAQFVLMTITSAVTIFVFFIMFFRMDLIIELLTSKPVLLLMGLAIGSTVGFLVGVLITYHKFNTELNNKKSEVKKLKKDLVRAENFIEEILPEAMTARKIRAAKSAKEAEENCGKRAQQIFSAIGNLSEKKTVIEDDITDADETFETQDEISDET